ncbi:MAG: MFS transporter [Betaproteobacteria bacterium]|nr:MFS transporter [Betaproteobacteria bacterium]
MNESGKDAVAARLVVLVFVPFASGFFISILLRYVNAVIAKDLARDFALSAAELGLLTSAYFLVFAAFQIPLGVLLDRYGPRRVLAALLCFACAGALVFGAADGVAELALGRALLGLGVSGCLMGSIKAFTLWFPLARLATLNGWILAIGALGAMSATTPVEALAAGYGWRAVFLLLALACATVAALIFFVVPEKPLPGLGASWGRQFSELGEVLSNVYFWRVALPLIAVHGAYQALQGLWLAPWLADVGGLARGAVASTLLAGSLAYGVGSVVFGTLADRIASAGLSRLAVYKFGMVLALGAFIALAAGVRAGALGVVVLYGFGACAAALPYAILSQHFPPALTGRVITASNIFMFLASFAFQWGIGALLRLWPALDGRYPAEGYAVTFGVAALLQLVTVAWLMPLKDAPRYTSGHGKA